MNAISDVPGFIRANTRLLPVPHAPEIKLWLADEATELWQKTEDDLGTIGLPPPFWAFAWAGGQALARYSLDHSEIVRGRKVLDFAAGSGLVAIAAAMAGAASVDACDIDAFAIEAIALNAAANRVDVRAHHANLIGARGAWDVILAGDISYERDMAGASMEWLRNLAREGADILIGDPGRAYLPREQLTSIADYQVPVTRALEDTEIKRTQVWRFK